jgi:arginine deiminase
MALLDVRSEIGPLRKVLVHAPGPEWDLVPVVYELAQQYLIEDILLLADARREHEALREVLGIFVGAENVIEFGDLLAEACDDATRREQIITATAAFEFLGDAVAEQLLDPSLSAKDVATALISGAILPQSLSKVDYKNLFRSVPNLLFTRDLGAVVGEAFVAGYAAKEARRRESLLTRIVLRHSRLLDGAKVIDIRNLANENFWAETMAGTTQVPWKSASLEGGDILVLNESTLLIGTGERTTEVGLTLLITMLVEDEELESPQHVVRVVLPEDRASMHLDTVLTVLDRKQFLVHEPIIKEAKFFVYEFPFDPGFTNVPPLSFREAMRRIGMKSVEVVSCGGQNSLWQSREQWTDGANLLAMAPGVVVGYDRNVETAKALEQVGYRYYELTNTSDRKQLEKVARRIRAGETGDRVLIGLRSSELSRARGGPRCMTLPLERGPAS